MLPVTEEQATTLEAAAFRRLVAQLQARTDVQNIDLMNLAGFCRNCLSNWLEEAAREGRLPVDKAVAREHVYGMPVEEWKARYQREATGVQQRAFGEASHQPNETPAPAQDNRASLGSRNAEA